MNVFLSLLMIISCRKCMQIQSVSKTGKYNGIQISFGGSTPERSTSDMLIFKDDSLRRRLICA